ncbi:MAG: hypothetical protein ABIA92_02275 [Patescibacteria group bacterium]
MPEDATLDADYPMRFEHLLCQVLGRKIGYQTAGAAGNAKYYRQYIKKVICKFKKRADELEMDTRLKEVLFVYLNTMENRLSKLKKIDMNALLLVDALFVISYLLGYEGLDGGTPRTPIYTQTLLQYVFSRDSDPIEQRVNLIKTRAEVIQQLKSEGLSTPQIAFILNTTDYEVKKLSKYYQN